MSVVRQDVNQLTNPMSLPAIHVNPETGLFQRRRRREIVQFVAVLLVPLIMAGRFASSSKSTLERPLEFDQTRLTKLEQQAPEVIVVGNSMVFCRLNPDLLASMMAPVRLETLAAGGAQALQWHLWLKNYVCVMNPSPKVVFIFYRDYDFNKLGYRTNDKYLELIRHSMQEGDEAYLRQARGEPAILGTPSWMREIFRPHPKNQLTHQRLNDTALAVAGVVGPQDRSQLKDAVNDVFDLKNLRTTDVIDSTEEDDDGATNRVFSIDPQINFLKQSSALAKQKGIRLIFYRVRRRPDANNQRPQPRLLREYTADFKAWAESEGHALMDENGDERITLELFQDGDHLKPKAYAAYTRLFLERIRHLLPAPSCE
jgi:hypothetical protein